MVNRTEQVPRQFTAPLTEPEPWNDTESSPVVPVVAGGGICPPSDEMLVASTVGPLLPAPVGDPPGVVVGGLAGWLMHTADGSPPSRVVTSATTEPSSRAVNASAEYGEPPRSTGVLSPNRRLNSRATRPGSINARRLAASPISSESSARNSNTEGITAVRVPSEQISAQPSRQTAAAVNVVPRSIPSTYTVSSPS